MQIDWFTVVAQTINFLILVWLLKRFLYQPILDAIDAREQRIAAELADAEAKRTEAQRERDEFQRKNEQFARQRETLFNEMSDEVSVARQRLLDDARQAAEAFRTKRREALQREQQSLENEISRRARHEVFAIARKALNDLADADLEACIIKVFTHRVRGLNAAAKTDLSEALTTSSEPARVRSAFALSGEQQASIQQTLNETFQAEIPIHFVIEPDGIGGIELTAGGRQVAWNIDDFLKLLEKSIGEITQEPATSSTRREAHSEPVS